MKKSEIFAFLIIVFLGLIAIYFLVIREETSVDVDNDDNEIEVFVECLVDSGMVVYASRTCPACAALSEEFGGYEAMGDLLVDCGQESQRCSEEMQTGFVPEIQIEGEIFEGGRSLEDFANVTGCQL